MTKRMRIFFYQDELILVMKKIEPPVLDGMNFLNCPKWTPRPKKCVHFCTQMNWLFFLRKWTSLLDRINFQNSPKWITNSSTFLFSFYDITRVFSTNTPRTEQLNSLTNQSELHIDTTTSLFLIAYFLCSFFQKPGWRMKQNVQNHRSKLFHEAKTADL